MVTASCNRQAHFYSDEIIPYGYLNVYGKVSTGDVKPFV